MIPQWKIEIDLGGWRDVSDKLMPGGAISITRGRPNELSAVSAGSASFTLDNSDGRFTQGLRTGAYYPNVKMFAPVRISAWDGGGWVSRFVGYVQKWPVSFTESTGKQAVVVCSCVDLLGLMGLKSLKAQAYECILAHRPVVYYPLDEASGATSAADLMGVGPGLTPTQVSSGGTLEFASTDVSPVPLEGAGMAFATRSSATAGLYLLSSSALPALGVEFTIGVLTNPTTSGYIWQLKQGAYILGLYYNASTSKYLVRQYSGSWSTLVSTSATKTGLHYEIVTVTATTVTLLSDATRTATARAAATFTAPILYVGYCNDTTSGFDDMPSAHFGQVSIIGRALAMAAAGEADVLAADVATVQTRYAEDLLTKALAWAGITATVGYLGSRKLLGYVATLGQSLTGLAEVISAGANGRFVAMRDGSLKWVDNAYAPTLLELVSGDVEPTIAWDVDESAYVTEISTTLPSGGSYRYAASTTSLIRADKSIQGVLATDQACKDMAQYVVSAASLDSRIPDAAFDLLTLDNDAIVAALLAEDIGSQIAISDLPPQIPDNQVLVVEGISETIGAEVWTLTFNTSPSSAVLPPDGWYFAYIDGPTTFIDDGLAYIANI